MKGRPAVRGRVRGRLSSLLIPYRREGRRQLNARTDRASRGTLPTPYHWVSRGRVPVVARLDPQLLLGPQQHRFADTVAQVLTEQRIPHWWVPEFEGDRRRLGVRVEHRSEVIATLADVAGPNWYVDVLGEDGRRQLGLLPARRLAARTTSQPAALLVWEFVVGDLNSGFGTDHQQGLRIDFWAETDPGILGSLASNLTVTRLAVSQLPPSGGVPAVLNMPLSSAVTFAVDVVYTWVDGEDEAWLATKARAAGVADERAFSERAHDVSRFADHDELRFSLRALEQFAPWVNHVWIVTAGQLPAWLDQDHPWVTVVSHEQIWPDGEGLPTFNSHAIEACLHRIPGLAEHFLYLNDDMIFGRPVQASQFFHPNGIGKSYASRALVDFAPSAAGEIASSTAAKNARRLLSTRFGVTFTRKFFHTAAALTVSGLTELEAEFPEVFAETRRAVFRTVHDVAAAGSFYLNWGFLTGRVVPGQIRYTYIDPAAEDARGRLAALARHRAFDTFCINDGATEQTVEERRRTDALIRSFLAGYLPVRGSFELELPPRD